MSGAALPFSLDGYRLIIDVARRAGYKLVPMKEALESDFPAMILRHDVDMSVICALDMARLEHQLGVRSTYFFMLTSEYYNIFNEASRAALKEIRDMGHEIGLHWDSRFLPEASHIHEPFFRAQMLFLSQAAGVAILSASQHIPIDTPVFDISPYVKFNAYSRTFNNRFTYVSDSSMVWRDKTPLDLIAAGVEIQFLAHPLWWMMVGANQDEKMMAAIKLTQEQLMQEGQSFATYMHGILAERKKYDERFANAMKERSKE